MAKELAARVGKKKFTTAYVHELLRRCHVSEIPGLMGSALNEPHPFDTVLEQLDLCIVYAPIYLRAKCAHDASDYCDLDYFEDVSH